ncbi:MAG: hypothetical protein CFE47_16470 [Pseudomonas sp. PGPPP1]|uniref:hypothetical protein n=1 Tax=Pseudomonas sp. PGPPP1 TaxID=2015553 RepID=UPI000BC8A817|nr:hypothetical protein [Pseudomonas sp. PGPPP1]OYU06330.1 MAG: hypothetical protein CFE47_16470 [Pseudomonas sp. PGPPP1]
MDIIEDFIRLTPEYFYLSLCFLLFITACGCGLRRFLGPIAVASIYFYGAALLMMGAGMEQFVQALVLVLLYFVSLVIGVRAPSLKFARSTLTTDSMPKLYNRLALFVLVMYAVFFWFLLSKFTQNYRIDKINWGGEAGVLSYVLSLLNGVLLSLLFLLLVARNYVLFLIVGCFLVLGGVVFGEKGVIINLAVVVISVIFQKPIRLKSIFFIFVLSIIISLLTVVFFFGAASSNVDDALVAFLARLVASFDGTMIILKARMYESVSLPNTVLYYIFDFIVSRIYGVSPGVGQMLASTNIYVYPENGGPNDSLINYFLLSDLVDKVVVCFFVSSFAFVMGALDAIVKTCRLNTYSAGWKFILLPLYFYMPTFFQATGTAFLLLARYYFLLFPVVIIAFFLRRCLRDVKAK